MSIFDPEHQEIYYKIVYYGPGLSGKTQNLLHLFEKTSPAARGNLLSLSANPEKTVRFDFLSLSFGEIHGLQVHFHLYALPGNIFYDANPHSLLQGTDGVIFVADSSPKRLDANIESLDTIQSYLSENEKMGVHIPFLVQYNKQDLLDALPLTKLQTFCNPRGAKEFLATAHQGIGVFETLKEMAKQVFGKRRRNS